jgi:hypothetical protein
LKRRCFDGWFLRLIKSKLRHDCSLDLRSAAYLPDLTQFASPSSSPA